MSLWQSIGSMKQRISLSEKMGFLLMACFVSDVVIEATDK